MKELRYKDFSLKFHEKKWREDQPSVCQFELTFACPLHCQHCYTDCHNNPEGLNKEMTTSQAISVLDKVFNSGALWLCLSGGDPLAREDFLEIYTYAKKRGFIVIIFTSGILITDEIADYFKRISPFFIELTLNGVTKKTYEAVSGVEGSFEKVMSSICRLKERHIPFKIKTQVTKQNFHEVDRIREFVEGLGLEFRPNSLLYARLNQNSAPSHLRIEPEEILKLNERFDTNSMDDEEWLKPPNCRPKVNRNLFQCAAGSGSFHIDPCGNMFLCTTVRRPAVNLLKDEITDGLELFRKTKTQKFKTDSKCNSCSVRHLCYNCPGRAYLETGDPEAPLEYFCQLAHLIKRRRLQIPSHKL